VVRAVWEYGAALVLLASFATWLLGAVGLVRGGRGMAVAAAASSVLGIIPVGGLSAASMVLSLSPSLSVAGTALWAALLAKRLTGYDILGVRGAPGLGLLILAVSVTVYVSYLGGIGADIYDSGYGFSAWDIILALAAALMFIRGSMLCRVLMACLAAHAMGLMGSGNIFDTIVDGPAFIASAAVVFRAALPARPSLPKRPGL